MNNISIYLEMLGLSQTTNNIEPEPNILICCGPIELNRREGNYSCLHCGLVKDPYYIVQEEEPQYPNSQLPLGCKSQYTYNRPRYYTPVTHFREHVRRYLGARFTAIPEQLLEDLRYRNIPILDIDAFQLVKTALHSLRHHTYSITSFNTKTKFFETKHVKSTSFYKDIFLIIYELGGKRPRFTQLNEIYQKYRELVYFFNNSKQNLNRRNMPCNYMLLDILLRELGHEPYYKLPYLKNQELQMKVVDIFKQLRNDQKNSRNAHVTL